nr:MAG: hypothetical protein TU35_08040 [Thermoproteus sp. AZ2]
MSEVEVAVECTKAIEAHISDQADEVKKSYAQRARHFHTDIYTIGTAYVIATAAARSTAKAVELGLSAPNCEELVKGIGEFKLKSEEKAYALYGGVLLYALKRGNYISSTNLGDAILELSSAQHVTLAAYKYAEWLKKLAEAYFK